MTEAQSAAARPVLVLRKVRRILECFTLEEPELGLQRIIKLTGLPASTCQRLVQNLVHEGFLHKDGDSYRIGLDLVRWAAPGNYGMDLVKLTGPVLERLRGSAEESAYLQVRDGPHRTIVALSEVRHLVIRRFMVGMVMPLHVGSAGKVFLAYDPAAWRDAVRHGLRREDDNVTVDPEALQEEVSETRERGYAVTFEERSAGAGSISAPVFGVDGGIVAAIGIGAPSQRFTPETAQRLVPLVVEAAGEASELMGCRSRP
ncbi:IclR family transcriptional regulator [Parasphingorhabdus pacifica]